MNYIILDLEATCWQDRRPDHVNEIIEIGALCIDENKAVLGEFNEMVKPLKHPILSDFCKQLTTIEQEMIDEADYYPEVIKRFQEWISSFGEDYYLCSWGFYDKKQFKQDCTLHHLSTDWLKQHISLKHQHGKFRELRRNMGMKWALEHEGIEMEGTHHRGIDDARNIAKIFVKCFDEWKF